MKKQVTWFFNVHFDCRLQNRFLDNCKLYMVNHLIGDYYIALLFANKLVGWGQFLQKTFKNKQHSRYIFWLLSITSFNLKKKVTFEVKINKSSAIMLYISISVIPKILKLSLASTNNLPMSWEAYFQIFK